MSELAVLDVSDGVATLRINRPDKRNALSLDLLAALRERAAELADRDDARCVVLRGEGRAFCAGMDLKAVLGEPGAPLRLLESIAELTVLLRELPQVVVARVEGAAIGGGCGLAAACDVVLTHPDAKLGFPEVDLGLCPAVVAPWVVQRVGPGRARRLLLLGGTFSGQQAGELGFADECVPREELDEAVGAMSSRIAAAGGRALAATKGLLAEWERERVFAAVRAGAKRSAEVVESDEAQERLAKMFG